jgi:hypothetical protein
MKNFAKGRHTFERNDRMSVNNHWEQFWRYILRCVCHDLIIHNRQLINNEIGTAAVNLWAIYVI